MEEIRILYTRLSTCKDLTGPPWRGPSRGPSWAPYIGPPQRSKPNGLGNMICGGVFRFLNRFFVFYLGVYRPLKSCSSTRRHRVPSRCPQKGSATSRDFCYNSSSSAPQYNKDK